ncbi:nitrilase/cyanide hydratase and apolipoprotein N-acyltransferase [Calothrix sp. NIES-4071]|nr:nitrilase/cyanide hydratase and apolipoprotein N-acyltransferase [Calothrix sp. NIES-4071]BAZ54731.1 nitrilase/cyanide hydratase and apolipoprotein N-acyltransferase [Calothrix sp. NIES-4105]
MESYRFLALPMTCHAVNLAANRTEALQMQKSIDRLAQQILVSLAFIGFDCRLIVLPEFFLSTVNW